MRQLTCAIHQPNLFPRPSTLAKLYAADIWIVLDDVQFNHRDYQHRTQLASLDDAAQRQWLTLPVHRPFGRATRINEVQLLDPHKSARRMMRLIQQYYSRSPHWDQIQGIVQDVATTITMTTQLAHVTEVSTRALLQRLHWPGTIVHSSDLAARQERSNRLADLTLATGANEYLCGTGGAKYLDEQPFHEHNIQIRYHTTPHHEPWQTGHTVSTLHWLAQIGATPLQHDLRGDRPNTV